MKEVAGSALKVLSHLLYLMEQFRYSLHHITVKAMGQLYCSQ